MSKPLWIVGGHDYRTPEEKRIDALIDRHEDGEHSWFAITDCPLCDEETLTSEKEN